MGRTGGPPWPGAPILPIPSLLLYTDSRAFASHLPTCVSGDPTCDALCGTGESTASFETRTCLDQTTALDRSPTLVPGSASALSESNLRMLLTGRCGDGRGDTPLALHGALWVPNAEAVPTAAPLLSPSTQPSALHTGSCGAQRRPSALNLRSGGLVPVAS